MQSALALPPATVSAPPVPLLERADDTALAARGDRQAFERVYRSHVGRVLALCLRMCGDRARAEELTQDAFVRAWERLPQFRGESAFGTWMHRLTVNVVLEARRREQRGDGELDDDTVGEPALATRVTDAERMDLAAAIAALPPGARTVFALHDVEGYRHEEIAVMLGITAGGSKAQLHRARRLLREALT